MDQDTLQKKVDELTAALNSDIIFYFGSICRDGYLQLNECLENRVGVDATLVLATFGGDPHAGYRIARAIRHHYKDRKFMVAIPGYCKSAGTLICIGASELVICDAGELGPLDVQISKPDEIFELSSGLDIIQALDFMNTNAMEAFKRYLIEIKLGSGITTKMAAGIARKLAAELYAPIYGHIDPVRLGEIQRAMLIAQAYGKRLDRYAQNLKASSLERLMASYPDHAFVIDRREARELFRRVREANALEDEVYSAMYNSANVGAEKPKVRLFRRPDIPEVAPSENEMDVNAKEEATDANVA